MIRVISESEICYGLIASPLSDILFDNQSDCSDRRT
jgi:hypothetical protein